MHGPACKQYISQSRNASIFNAKRFDEVLSQASAKKPENKNVKGFKFHTFIGRFQILLTTQSSEDEANELHAV